MLRYLILATTLLLGFTAIYHLTGLQALGNLAERASNRLVLFVSNLEGKLDQYRNLPKLLSSNRRLIDTLQHQHLDTVNDTNVYLESVADATGASDIYLMALDGETIAASNWDRPRSFIGLNFAFRPYFQMAIEGNEGRYFALGTTSGKRGYYLSHPVSLGQDILGVIVVKIDLADIESAWSEQGNHFLVSDNDGVIFLSTQPSWTYRSLFPLPERRLTEILDSQRYADQAISPINLTRVDTPLPGIDRLRVDGMEYLHLTRAMPDADWLVHLMTNTSVADDQRQLRATVAGFGLLLVIALIALYLINRQRRLALQFSTEMLEQRVQTRTRELQNEIEIRNKAEQSLRDTQSELIQAAKMAGLGQMSAGIGHELNQPLTAIRNNTENAVRLIGRGQTQNALENLSDISELTNHMAAIISQLRDFSRKSSGERSETSLVHAIEQALDMFAREIETQGIAITKSFAVDIVVKTDPVLLNQVLVNLLSNAIQAQFASENPTLKISIFESVDRASIALDDGGPGIDPDIIDRLFDPFFTTKEVGLGLGLGLSISYRIMDQLGGSILASNLAEGGARFTLNLPRDRT